MSRITTTNTPSATPLQGSPRQIAWALKLQQGVLRVLDEIIAPKPWPTNHLYGCVPPQFQGNEDQRARMTAAKLDVYRAERAKWAEATSAEWIIENHKKALLVAAVAANKALVAICPEMGVWQAEQSKRIRAEIEAIPKRAHAYGLPIPPWRGN